MALPVAAALCSSSSISIGAGRSRTACCGLCSLSHSLSVLPSPLASRCLRRRPLHHHQRCEHRKARVPFVGTAAVALRLSSPRAAASSLQHLGVGEGEDGVPALGLLDRLRAGTAFIRSVLPGGSWWALEKIIGEGTERRAGATERGVSVFFAFGRMWQLVANERWIIFAGFASLLLAAVCAFSLSPTLPLPL